MRLRGIGNPDELLQFAEPERILAACRWWDKQTNAGAGVLAKVIRGGGMADLPKRTLLEEQRQYGEDIKAWLRKNFPEFDRPRWGPHPAAIAAVIQLHHRDGKKSLTKRKHGAEIRAAVKRWEKNLTDDEGED